MASNVLKLNLCISLTMKKIRFERKIERKPSSKRQHEYSPLSHLALMIRCDFVHQRRGRFRHHVGFTHSPPDIIMTHDS